VSQATDQHNDTDLKQFLEEEVLPRLTAEDVFTDAAHNWQKTPTKWRGGCPWHKSKSGTSFYIDPQTLLWRCAGCNDGGGPVKYLWRLQGGTGSPQGEDFIVILRQLAELAGVPFPERELTEEEKEGVRRREARRNILEDVTSYCERTLWSEAGTAARDYLRERGFSDEATRDLRLGFYDDAALLKRFLAQQDHQEADVAMAAVLRRRLEGYITFPWQDDRGQPLTLYGTWHSRTPPEGTPKKIALPNPKDEKGKSWEPTKRSPYLLDRALRAGHENLTLVEGLTDAAVAHAHGDTSVIACVAAQLSFAQVKTLARRRVNAVTIALDPDSAGDRGIESCVGQLLGAGITPYVAPKLPDGMDPDEFILTRGIDAWKAHVAGAQHAYRYKAESIIRAHRPETGWTDMAQDAAVAAASAYAKSQPDDRAEELGRRFWPLIAEETGADLELLRHGKRGEPSRNGEDSHEQEQKPDEPPPAAAEEERSTCEPPPDAGDAWEPPPPPPPPPPKAPEGFTWKAVELPTLLRTARRPEMLVKRVLVRHQPMIVGAPQKTLKTSVMCDMAVSLATATPFLGKFDVYKPVKVALLSGESGEWNLGQTLARVCRARDLNPKATAGRLVVQGEGLPQLSNIEHMIYLKRMLEWEHVEVFILDPLYLTLLAGLGRDASMASNIYAMGPLFQNVTRACLDVGASPCLVHHTTRPAAASREPLGLESLAYAGVAEFCRQWLLLSRREAYDGAWPGLHKLWMNCGGSAGHGGVWSIDIREGEADDNLEGRVWNVSVSTAIEARQHDQDAREAAKARNQFERDQLDDLAVMSAIDQVTARGTYQTDDGRPAAGHSTVRDVAGLNNTRARQAVQRLLNQKLIRELNVTCRAGNGAASRGTGYIRVREEM
jgi:DNA primase catalytic core